MSRLALSSLVLLPLLAGCGLRSPGASEGAPDGGATHAAATTAGGFTRAADGSFALARHATGLSAEVAARGLSIAPAAGSGWSLTLRTEGDERPARASGARVEIDRGPMTEWVVDHARGVEHGWTFSRPPRDLGADGRLRVRVRAEGLHPVERGDHVELLDGARFARIGYGELAAKDAAGRALPSAMHVEGETIAIEVDASGARWPVEIDPLVFALEQSLTYGGNGADLSGDTAVVPYGADVKVFGRTGATWGLQTSLTPVVSGELALDKDTLVASTTVQLVVYTRAGATWGAPTSIAPPSGSTGFGHVAVRGATIAAVGSNAVHVYVASGASWTLQQTLTTTAIASQFGGAISLGVDRLAVAAPGEKVGGTSGVGAVYVFDRSGSVWSQSAKLTGNPAATEGLGSALALDGDTLALAALFGYSSPRVDLYTRSAAGTWTRTAQVAGPSAASTGGWATSIALRSGALVIGAPTEGSSGAVHVYGRSGATWLEGPKLTTSSSTSSFGAKVALSGDTLLVGSSSTTEFFRGPWLGASCSTAADCMSGYCADGVCCDGACTGTCEACSAAKKGSGASGTCGPIKDGTSPDAECAGPTCAAGSYEPSHVCNGAGACRATSSVSCGTYGCNGAGTACNSTCSKDADCVASSACTSGTCTPKKANGGTCGRAPECTSGSCVDGVCCDVPCNGTCQACSAARKASGADGTCGATKDGLDSKGACAATACASGTRTSNVCNGAGACRPEVKACAPYPCNASGTDCDLKCTADGDCGAGNFCNATGACAPKADRGASCASDKQCTSGFCADGTCCDNACVGACQACGEPGSKGTCVPVKGAPRTGHPACASSGTTCGGMCDGSKAFDCSYPGAATTCGTGCKDGAIARCDGTGACAAATACTGSFACADATACKSSCLADTDCAGGFSCKSGACSQATSTCSSDGMSSVSPKGESQACAPYRCVQATGACATGCTTTGNDCSPGYLCDTASQQCVSTPATSEDSKGCGFGRTSGYGAGLGLALVALGLLRRRAR